MLMDVLFIEGLKSQKHTSSGTATASDTFIFSTVPISERTAFIFYPEHFLLEAVIYQNNLLVKFLE